MVTMSTTNENVASSSEEFDDSPLKIVYIFRNAGIGKTPLINALTFAKEKIENQWERLARLFTDEANGGLNSIPLHWKHQQTEFHVSASKIVYVSGTTEFGKTSLINALSKEKYGYGKRFVCYVGNRSWGLEDMPSSSPRAKQKLISGVYSSVLGNSSYQVLKMEHSALQGRNSQWNLEVKYKLRENKASTKRWVNIWNFYPDAKVELKHNVIELTISSPNEDHEFAVFGTPEIGDKKRMQMGIFGEKPTQGKHWHIFVTLLDDTMMAFQRVCEREESKGRQLLTTLAGLFVSNSDEDIKINVTALEDGWKIVGSNLMTIKSKDAWNAPENSTDFPYCVFEIAHLDETKQTFLCGIQASHLNDTAETELVAFFEQEQENEVHLNSQNFISSLELTIEEYNLFVFFTDEENGGLNSIPLHWKHEQTVALVCLMMLVFFVGCLTGTRFDPPHPLKTDETDGNVLLSWKESKPTDGL